MDSMHVLSAGMRVFLLSFTGASGPYQTGTTSVMRRIMKSASHSRDVVVPDIFRLSLPVAIAARDARRWRISA
jgi:hypothetical protein